MTDRVLFILTSFLIAIGIIFSYSLTTYTILHYKYNEFHFLIRELAAGVISIYLMWQISILNPKRLKTIGMMLFLIFFFLMIIMYFLPSSFVTDAGGAKRWIRLPGFSLAPVEFFKIGFVYFLSWSFSRKFTHTNIGHTLQDELKLIFPYIVIFIFVVIIIAVFQNDLGQVMVLGLTLSFMLFFAGRSFKLFASLITSAFILFIFFIFISEHRIKRILTWWAMVQKYILSFLPDFIAQRLRVEKYQIPEQITSSLQTIHNGKFLGVGIGNGNFKLGFLSEVHTDFVLAGIAEEIGYIGIFIITAVFAVLIFRILKIASKSKEQIDYLFCIGVALLLGFSFLINSYGISGLTPIKGLAVPFVSYGGSSMVANAIAIGMVLLISKKDKI